MSEKDGEIRIGQHVVELAADDVVHIRWIGDVTADEIYALGKLFAQRPHRGCGVFLVQDHAKLGAMSAPARKAITNDPNSLLVRDVVIYNASFHLRIIMTMIQKAMHTFRPAENAAMTFCDSEGDAMRFVNAERQRLPQGNVTKQQRKRPS